MAGKRSIVLRIVHSTGKNNKEYYALVLDLGYCVKYVGFGAMLCAEVAGVYPVDLASLCPLNGSYDVGVFTC